MEIKPVGRLSDKERRELEEKNSPKRLKSLGEQRLLTKKVLSIKPMFRKNSDGEDAEIKGVFRVKLEGGTQAVFKICDSPTHGKNCSCNKSEANYDVDKALNINLVPTTVIREISDEALDMTDIGSLQEYVENEGSGEDIVLPPEELVKLRILDFITYAYDDHEGNYVSTSEGIKAVDRERTFGVDPGISDEAKNLLINELKEIENVVIPDEVVDIFENLMKNPETLDRLKTKLSSKIGKEDAEETIERILTISEPILKNGKLSDEDIEKLFS